VHWLVQTLADFEPNGLYQVKKYPQYNFINLDLLDTCATTNNLLEIERYSNYTFVRGDIGNMDLVPILLVQLSPPGRHLKVVCFAILKAHKNVMIFNPRCLTLSFILASGRPSHEAPFHRNCDALCRTGRLQYASA
jgi:hypothetical protein